MDRKTRILFVCLGNICRSAAAEAVMKAFVEKHGAADRYLIDSAGILNYHEGEYADPRMIQAAQQRGYMVTSISRPVQADDFDIFDIIVGMDDDNVESLHFKAQSEAHRKKIHQMTEFAIQMHDRYVPDPYYGGTAGFAHVMDLLEDTCEGLYQFLENGGK